MFSGDQGQRPGQGQLWQQEQGQQQAGSRKHGVQIKNNDKNRINVNNQDKENDKRTRGKPVLPVKENMCVQN